MILAALENELNRLHEIMDGAIDGVSDAAQEAQEQIYKFITDYVNRFEISDGRYVVNQDFTARFAYIQNKITSIIGDIYRPSIKEYLGTFSTVEEINIALQRDYNQLVIDTELLSPARQSIYKQAEYYLKEGLADAYVQPTKYLLMQQVSQGITLKDSLRILKRWNNGELSAGSQLTSGRATPNLSRYSTQIARDSIYGYHGTINEVIANEYDLKGGIYTGGLVEDSRPGCVYLVGLKRKIHIDEIPNVIKKFPEGVKPNTTKKNFPIVRMGYSCQHSWFAVRWRDTD